LTSITPFMAMFTFAAALRQRLRAGEGVVQLGERNHEVLVGVRQVAGMSDRSSVW
jgi:hypothetical protein